MNLRQRFDNQMHYRPLDRSCLFDFNMWNETIPQWHTEGLPESYSRANIAEYFGFDASLGGGTHRDWDTGANQGLVPGFEPSILQDDGDTYTVVQNDGVVVKRQRSSVSIPMHVGHTLVDRESWKKHYKPRLDPDRAGRLPGDWDRRAKVWTDPNRDHPVFVDGGSLFGRLRDWMGLENISMVVYDDPAWFEEMVVTLADLHVAILEKILATGGQFQACSMWEDMCYNAGPLLSPTHFKQYLVPQYQRITGLLRKHNVDIVWVDCDGKVDQLLPLWLEAGVNCMFPIEVGTWGADPVKFRAQYGRDLRLIGGFDKHILARSKNAITAEITRLAPLVEAGGYIPMPDHRVPPDVRLENYLHYCRTARAIWGKGVDLPPMTSAAQVCSP